MSIVQCQVKKGMWNNISLYFFSYPFYKKCYTIYYHAQLFTSHVKSVLCCHFIYVCFGLLKDIEQFCFVYYLTISYMQRSLKILSIFVLPCFIAESAYKVWWYTSGASQIPFLGNVYLSDAVACAMELLSWLYRTTVIFLVCVLFRLICHLQILRLKDFATMFHVDSDVASVLAEHLRIRRHLRIISHRCRGFILWALVLVTSSQFACLLITTKSTVLNIYRAGELAVSIYLCPWILVFVPLLLLLLR